MSVTNINSITAELVTMLAVCILIDGKEILPDVFRNEDITKGVLVSGTHIEPIMFMLLMRLHF